MKKIYQKTKWIILGVLALSSLRFFCAPVQAQSIDLWVTQNFNQQKVLEKSVSTDNKSVLEILRSHADIKTAYAGGFVTEINGIASNSQMGGGSDWFYYVNGKLAHVGALAYMPKSSDVVWWDYHRWRDAIYISSVVGSYPQPFVTGYNGEVKKTMIIATSSLLNYAKRLGISLQQQGVSDLDTTPFRQGKLTDTETYKILIGSWNDIKNDPKIKDIVKHHKKTGMFITFQRDSLVILDINGKKDQAFNQASAVVAIGSGFHETLPLWIITGTDDEQVKKMIELLINEPERIKLHSGIVLANERVLNVPLLP